MRFLIENHIFKKVYGHKGNITVPDGITEISHRAFADCLNLTQVNIPESVTAIGDEAFKHCTNLININIALSVNFIGKYAFQNCCSLTQINIPAGVTEIGEAAFWSCGGLTQINIPEGVAQIHKAAFQDCTGLTQINIPQSVTAISQEAFKHCINLRKINFSENVVSIDGSAFHNCYALRQIILPENITCIGAGAFNNCTALTQITLPIHLSGINKKAFVGCHRLLRVIVDSSSNIAHVRSLFSGQRGYTMMTEKPLDSSSSISSRKVKNTKARTSDMKSRILTRDLAKRSKKKKPTVSLTERGESKRSPATLTVSLLSKIEHDKAHDGALSMQAQRLFQLLGVKTEKSHNQFVESFECHEDAQTRSGSETNSIATSLFQAAPYKHAEARMQERRITSRELASLCKKAYQGKAQVVKQKKHRWKVIQQGSSLNAIVTKDPRKNPTQFSHNGRLVTAYRSHVFSRSTAKGIKSKARIKKNKHNDSLKNVRRHHNGVKTHVAKKDFNYKQAHFPALPKCL